MKCEEFELVRVKRWPMLAAGFAQAAEPDVSGRQRGLQHRTGRGPAAPTGPAPKLANGQPDFSGVWQGGGPVGDLEQGMPKGEKIPLNAEGTRVMASRQSKDDPEANCLPTGVPRIAPYPWRMLQTPTHVFILFEGNIHSYRQIFVDGRKHPEDPDPTWYGHSVGHYEGNSLVVDTVGFNDRFWFDFRGHPALREAAHARAVYADGHGLARRRDDDHRPRLLLEAVHDQVHGPAASRRRADGVHLPGERTGRRAHQGPGGDP